MTTPVLFRVEAHAGGGKRLSAAGVLALVAISCGTAPDRKAGAPAAAPIAVSVAPATTATIAERLEAGGVVTARETAVIASRLVAPILEVRVRAGDRVKRGDVLVALDARDIAAQSRQAAASTRSAEQGLARAEAERAAAEADRTLAVAWHARIAALRARNSATAQELDEAQARVAGAAARLTGAQAAIDAARASADASRAAAEAASTTESFTILRAPFDGLVTERMADAGSLATPGAPLLRVDAAGPVRVEAGVDEARVAFLRPGERVSVAIEGLGTGEDDAIDGTVREIARAEDAGARAFTITIDVPPTVRARTGTFARVRFRGAPRPALVIPPQAVTRQGQVTAVFVAQDGSARLRLVQIGAVAADGVEVLAGLDPGEQVVTSPPPTLVDGARITIQAQHGASGVSP